LSGQINEKILSPQKICWDRMKMLLRCHPAWHNQTLRPLYSYQYTKTFCLRRVMLRLTYSKARSGSLISACPRKSIQFHVFHCNPTICSSLGKKRWSLLTLSQRFSILYPPLRAMSSAI